jgi:hypothetical protein
VIGKGAEEKVLPIHGLEKKSLKLLHEFLSQSPLLLSAWVL